MPTKYHKQISIFELTLHNRTLVKILKYNYLFLSGFNFHFHLQPDILSSLFMIYAIPIGLNMCCIHISHSFSIINAFGKVKVKV